MLRLGKHEIAGYRLEERVGMGGAAIVYRAYQARLDRWVAVKVLELGDGEGRSFLERFRSEARAVATLHHPNVLSIHDYGEDQGFAFIVMEYIAGGSLDRFISKGPMSVDQALALALPVGEALAYAHSQDIIHRDVKPSNILMPRPDWPLVADFGLAGGSDAYAGVMRSSITTASASYLSPEQVVGANVDQRADIYSLGLILYEMLTGTLPFASKSTAEAMMRRMHEDPLSPRELNPAIPEAVETVLLRALARDLDARYGQMMAFVNDLRSVVSASGDGARSPGALDSGLSVTMQLSVNQDVVGPRLFIATSGTLLPIPLLDEVLVGRSDPMRHLSPDIDLEPFGGGSAGISRQHARLLRKPDGWYLEDCRSTNGTYLNEVRLLPHRAVRVRSGDLFRFAQMTLVFEEA